MSAAQVPITSAVVLVTSSRTSSRTSDEVTARVASNSRASLRSCSSWAAEASAPAPARAGGGSAARSSRENRRWPPGVRRDATFPESAQRRSVLALTPSSSEACRTRSHSECRPPDARRSLIPRSIGVRASKLHHRCHRLFRGLGSGGAEEAEPRRQAPRRFPVLCRRCRTVAAHGGHRWTLHTALCSAPCSSWRSWAACAQPRSSTSRCARAKARWCRSRDLNPDAAKATEDFKSPASTSSATPAREEYTTRPLAAAGRARQRCGYSRSSARPQRTLREGQRCALEDVGLAAAHLGKAEGAAGLPGDEGAGEDHVLAPLLDARQAAALFVGEPGEFGDRGVDVGQAEHVTVDKLGAVLAQAELVGHERGVGAGHAHGAARGAVGVAGTYTTLVAHRLGLREYRSELVHRHVLSLADIDAAIAEFAGLTNEQRGRLAGIQKGREDVILAGALIAREACRAFGLAEVRCSEADILEGAALALAEGSLRSG